MDFLTDAFNNSGITSKEKNNMEEMPTARYAASRTEVAVQRNLHEIRSNLITLIKEECEKGNCSCSMELPDVVFDTIELRRMFEVFDYRVSFVEGKDGLEITLYWGQNFDI